jgi:DMSO/TMAO reductase YedYZ molybdopterin-dependent catalytic subunit
MSRIVHPISRRTFLRGALGATALTLTGGALRAVASEGLISHVTRPLDAETPVEVLTTWLTPNERFFVRSHFGPPPADSVNPSAWRLQVRGVVKSPLALTMEDLRAFEEVTITAVLQCSGNGRAFYRPKTPGVQWRRGAVGNAQWTGVRLADVLRRAGLEMTARHVAFLGADRPVLDRTPLFLRSIPLEKGLHRDTLLAYRMNGEPLPLLHGAPLRVITPGWMADACTKWLTDITVLEREAEGYYMDTAYRYPARPGAPGEPVAPSEMDPVTRMVVKSLIVSPADGMTLPAGEVIVRGVAWSGDDHLVTRVEVSVDEGRTWEDAALAGDEVPYAWRQWNFVWRDVRPGTHAILSRATDDHGTYQPLLPFWNPGGFLWNGPDRVSISVTG